VLPFNAWPAYVGGLVVGTIPLFPDVATATGFFFASLPFNFYALFAVATTLALALGKLPWMGARLAAARRRSLEGGLLDRPGAQPMLLARSDLSRLELRSYTPSLVDFLLPLGVLIGGGALPILLGFGSRINEAFLAAVLTAMIVAGVRGMGLDEIVDAFVHGCSQMTIGAIVLGLAVTVGSVSKELDTAGYLVSVVAGRLDPLLLPGLLTLLCMLIAFATGTSWGTYAVVFPVALPLAFSLDADPTYVQICFGAVLGGAVFGDQCSPISDTTILSSMFTGCDLMDHVQTQLPLALAAAGLGIVASTLAAFLLV
jgi:Na+/H+ antiporter NhaC